MRTSIECYINETHYIFSSSSSRTLPTTTLLQALRQLKLTGTKLGCGEGGCGACTVVVSKINPNNNTLEHSAINACLAPLCSIDGCHVTTVEGLKQKDNTLHPMQKVLADFHGSQCGFCTPGIVMALTALIANGKPTQAEIEHQFDGNLCRCTGYRPILDAAKVFASDAECCQSCPEANEGVKDIEDSLEIVKSCTRQKLQLASVLPSEFPLPFPQELEAKALFQDSIMITGTHSTWYRPSSLEELLDLKQQHQEHAKLVNGNTEVGIEMKFKHRRYTHLVHTIAIKELNVLEEGQMALDSIERTGIIVGGAITLHQLDTFILQLLNQYPQWKTRSLQAIHDMLQWFASRQIRNVAALAGNIATASPISDMNPLLVALNAQLTVTSTKRQRVVNMRTFFLGYRKVDLAADEIIQTIFVPFTRKWEYIVPFKQARRREDDISIVCAGIRMLLSPGDTWKIAECAISYGGMGPTTISAPKTQQQLLESAHWSAASFTPAYDTLAREIGLPSDVPGGMSSFRGTLAISFLFKFFLATCIELRKDITETQVTNLPPVPAVEPSLASAATTFVTEKRPVTCGTQQYSIEQGKLQHAYPTPHAPNTKQKLTRAPVGDPVIHQSSYLQVSGEAQYVDDLPPLQDTLHAALVLSSKPHAKILHLNPEPALKLEGVVAFFSAKDIVGSNVMGPVVKDEECFRESVVQAVGQPLGIIVATSLEIAQEGSLLVQVEYDELPSILTIQEAIEQHSFFSDTHSIHKGSVAHGFEQADVVVEGEMEIGGQEHFYLEPNGTLCVPEENHQMKVYSSTQNPTKTQMFVANVLGVPSHKVNCVVKRMGGGFGGKETRSIFVSCACAVAANALAKPVKLILDRDVDMMTTGTRHPFYGKYKVGAMKDGKLVALELQMYCNAGYSLDLSQSVMDRALFHCENAYEIPNVSVNGKCCKTNISSNTAFRGFGGPQGMLIAETYMDHLAKALQLPPHILRERNLYQNNATTPYGQVLEGLELQALWQQTLKESNFNERLEMVKEFNQHNRWRKRGIAIIPTKFGISFTAKFMNQGGALVHIYTDGSILVSHGGTEMGQGLHTKVMQIVARAFNVELSRVHIKDTATDKVANSSPTAASMSTDLYGMAALHACEQIEERLVPVIAKLPETATFEEIVRAAYFDRINLSAQGFYTVPSNRCGYDWDLPLQPHESNAKRGQAFNYFTTGVACTEVELDVLTGDFQMRRADLVMDIGSSINSCIDIGQIEGAFIQGFGLFTMEELVWGDQSRSSWIPRGHLFTKGPGTYKIPAANDVPLDFRVVLSENKKNPFAVHSSKAIGEPPFFLASSAFFAVKEAIAAARVESGVSDDYFLLCSPVTAERARLSCEDSFVKLGKIQDQRV